MVKKIAIVSLSQGTIGEHFVSHEVELGLKRLKDMGVEVVMMPHAMSGIEYVKNHPKERAEDLLQALADDSVDMILCAIGGDDTYRLLPYLFENDDLVKYGKEKIFLGFSDSTMNHLMFYKAGFRSFYGQSFLADICEIDNDIYPYTKQYFIELITTGRISEIRPSDVWYSARTDFSTTAIGTSMEAHENQGFISLQGARSFSGEILGGCIDTLYDIFDNTRYVDSVDLCSRYSIFPSQNEWEGKILLLETSEEAPVPELYKKMLFALKNEGVFDVVSGIICGKPIDEKYNEEYQKLIVDVVGNKSVPIVANINVGHATPRCIIPLGVRATVDVDEQVIRFD